MLAVQSLSAAVTEDSAMQAELQVNQVFHFSIHRTGHHSFLDRSSHADRFLRGLEDVNVGSYEVRVIYFIPQNEE